MLKISTDIFSASVKICRDGYCSAILLPHQDLSYGFPPEIDLQSSRSNVTYEVKTTAGHDDVYMGVVTRREGKEQVVVNIILSRFGPNYPAERRYTQAMESACGFIKGPLKVKAP